MAISVYYPYYDIYVDITAPKPFLPMIANHFRTLEKQRLNAAWLNIPDQDYIQPSNNNDQTNR